MIFFSDSRPLQIFNLILQDTLQHFIYGAQRLHSTHYTVYNESRKRRRRKAYIIQQIEVHSQHSSSFILNANFPRFIVNLALSCIQLLFTHRLHLPDKMSVSVRIIFSSIINDSLYHISLGDMFHYSKSLLHFSTVK